MSTCMFMCAHSAPLEGRGRVGVEAEGADGTGGRLPAQKGKVGHNRRTSSRWAGVSLIAHRPPHLLICSNYQPTHQGAPLPELRCEHNTWKSQSPPTRQRPHKPPKAAGVCRFFHVERTIGYKTLSDHFPYGAVGVAIIYPLPAP